MRPKALTVAVARIFYFFAAMQFMAYYVTTPKWYLTIGDYLAGRERLPFQERILTAVVANFLLSCAPLVRAFQRLSGVFMPVERGAYFLISLLAFCVASIFCVKLHRAVAPQSRMNFLVYPAFIYITMWSYLILVQQHFFYPYDMASLAFFTMGVYFVYTRQFVPVCLVMLVGTANRETTLFLVGIFVLDAATNELATETSSLRERFRLSQIPWPKVLALVSIWLAVKLPLHYRFQHNFSEDLNRVHENLPFFGPKHWPALMDICGYILPLVVLMRRRLKPQRFANYLLILPVWLVIMFFKGILIETRIYGELSSFTAVAAVILIEEYVTRPATEKAVNIAA